MPTKIDTAISQAKLEISAAVEHAASTAADDEQDLSPLFRDEVQRQEMRYLDIFLSPERPDSSSSLTESKDADKSTIGVGRDACNNLNRGLNDEPSELSRIAKLMGPNNYHDSPLPVAQMAGNDCEERQSVEIITHSQSKSAASNLNTSHAQPHSETRRSAQVSNQTHNKTAIKRPTPSMNKRRQFNHRLLQKAKLKSREVATTMIRFANLCTRNATSLSQMIRGSVGTAVRKIHVLLEEKEDYSGHTHASSKASDIRDQYRSSASQSGQVPPMNAFSFAPKWTGVNVMKQQAKDYVDKSLLSANK